MNQMDHNPPYSESVHRTFSQLCSVICVTPGDKNEQRQQLITFILAHPEARAQFVRMIIANSKLTRTLGDVGHYCIKVLQWHEFAPPPKPPRCPQPARIPAEWTVCPHCGAELKTKRLDRHRKHCPALRHGRNKDGRGPAPKSARSYSRSSQKWKHHHPRRTSHPNHCTRCGRYVMWLFTITVRHTALTASNASEDGDLAAWNDCQIIRDA
jgi:hypothetical protein